jgi:site-specific recombinase XerD
MGRRMKIRLRYVQAYRSGGRVYYYFRRAGVRVALPGQPGSPEFMEAYQAAQGNRPVFDNHPSGTVGALIAGYCASGDFRNLKPNTQSAYRIVLSQFGKAHGHRLVRDMTRDNARKIIEGIGKPGMANLTRSVLKRIMRHAVDRGWRDTNPVVGIQPYKIGTRHTWTDQELAAYEARWPLGTRERLAYAALLYTGQRGGDVVRMERPQPGATSIAVTQEKTGAELVIPINPELRAAIKAGPTSLRYLITDTRGRPIKRPALTLLIRAAAEKAGLSRDCAAHGLRKSLLRRLAEDGKSSKEIASISGHKSLREIERYTAAADQAKLARSAMKVSKPRK